MEADGIRSKLSSELDLRRDQLRKVEEQRVVPNVELASLRKRQLLLKKLDPSGAELQKVTNQIRECKTTLEPLNKRRNSLKGRIKTIQDAVPTAGLSVEIGEVVARSSSSFFDSPTGSKLLKRLEELKIAPRGELGHSSSASEESSGGLVGKTFVLTGTLSSMSRDAAAEEIPQARRERDQLR